MYTIPPQIFDNIFGNVLRAQIMKIQALLVLIYRYINTSKEGCLLSSYLIDRKYIVYKRTNRINNNIYIYIYYMN